MDDSRETIGRRAFVTGYPVSHSRSPLIHGHWLKTLGIAGNYQAHAVSPADFPGFIASLKDGTAGFVGGNVTIPHKEQAFALADRPDELAQELGAANTLWLENGQLMATNTDGHGFVANLDARHPGWDKVETAVVLGAGGASRAIIQAVRNRGIGTIHVVNRTLDRARELADRFGPSVHAHPEKALREVMQSAGLFINTTSLGMDGGGPVPAIDFTTMARDAVATDIVYVPLKTEILVQAERQGIATVDGLGMLLHQAVPGFEKWFGQRPEVDDRLRQLVIADMEAHK
ncbi:MULTISPECIES: shikimate dehydrogenase [unclassified Rhizobium]|uniref:shikimate dehydrogenase n=1 Tax=unclassified Rhizobium TaxID=2613769 RepID=UPI001ADA47FF|nr:MULTISPECIES: shikimate dehydrogenase [unclassified Rhizobium]MBO9100405.1 shikimate dehydrogenase [Rhizobium sp. L58/93]MBO9170341.1 shikimate dehydrogenase [Rhizobium sp. L245/93]MBO9186298.1 shikimate dehydrogenase [Rhizobium sp. E27B/91]QXZ83210.1 shikimate dehydrogenase [Rhizobium sp. K1/93]QXZ89278.1 shikimate dehydrogenase [Rhizobium sp. K15/93]